MKNQILELEKKYWQGMQDGDYDTVKSLTRFPCIVAGKSGVRSVDESSFKKMFESGKGNLMKVLSISEEQIQLINDTSAIIAYLIEMEYMVDGKQSNFKCACTSTWVNENGDWVCAMHTESELEG